MANILDGLVAEMTAKGFAWMGYASLLGQGYAAGWDRFQRTAAQQAEVDALPGQIACLVLDVVTAGVLGGVMGSLGRAGRVSAGTVDTLGPTLAKLLGLGLAVKAPEAPPAPADPLTKALGFAETVNRETARQIGALATWRVAVTASDAPLGPQHVAQTRSAVDAWRKTCPLLKDLPKESAQTLADDFERQLWARWLPGLLETTVKVLSNPLALPGERGFLGIVGAHFARPGEVVAARLRALGAPLRTPWDATAHTLLLSWAKHHSKEMI
ncbi:MAG: hypothetical protein H6704_28690 [Myxococcales bacterium]|nr:hypothetical protein [Myxococcales bacterium]